MSNPNIGKPPKRGERVTLVVADDDYKHPPADPKWELGDQVVDRIYNYGVGVIAAIDDHYVDRGGVRHDRLQYRVDWKSGGSSMRFGYELLPDEGNTMNNPMTQDRVFELYVAMARNSSYARTGHFDIAELAERFPESDVIEMLIVMCGSSQIDWEYGHVYKYMDTMIQVFGTKLIPYLEARMKNPFHGGGTAYGESHLTASRNLCVMFCQQALTKLRDLQQSPSDPVGAYFSQFAGGIE